jgi:hypothetical protein
MLLTERERLPGWKCARGFFSMGSTARADSSPYVRLIMRPSLFSFVWQNPLSPDLITHILGQMIHLRALSPNGSANLDSISKQGTHEGEKHGDINGYPSLT